MQLCDGPEVGSIYQIDGDFALTRSQRRRGLAGRNRDEVDSPMVFEKCRSIHTFGMRFDLLVIFLDKDNKVLGSKKVIPRRVVWGPRRTHTIVEVTLD